MTTPRNSRSARRGKLGIDERRLLEEIAESGKAFSVWPTQPEMVPIDLAVRAAERAYRRGVVQGAHFMLWHLYPHTRQPGSGLPVFLDRLNRWRQRGNQQEHAKAELPPEWETSRRRIPR